VLTVLKRADAEHFVSGILAPQRVSKLRIVTKL
jgi:hypothetical protein